MSLVRILGLQVQKLGHDQVRDLIIHRCPEEDDPLVEEAAVNVEGALPTGSLLNDHRDKRTHVLASFASGARLLPTLAIAFAPA